MALFFVTFGPSKSYVVAWKNGWNARAREGSSILKFIQEILKADKGEPHSFAFGMEGCYFISYTLPDGTSKWRWSNMDKYYPALAKWLDVFNQAKSWRARGLAVTLGPKSSYWAWEKNSGHQYSSNLPRQLVDKLVKDKGKLTPPHVTLGLHDSFVYWNDDGTYSMNISGYRGAKEWLKKHLTGDIKIVVASLSAFQDDAYFFLLSDGTSTWQVPETMESDVQRVRDKYIK